MLFRRREICLRGLDLKFRGLDVREWVWGMGLGVVGE